MLAALGNLVGTLQTVHKDHWAKVVQLADR
jgi:hypothetical protein